MLAMFRKLFAALLSLGLLVGSAGAASASTHRPAGQHWTHVKPAGDQWSHVKPDSDSWSHLKPAGDQWSGDQWSSLRR